MSAASTASDPCRLIEEEVSYKRPDATGEVATIRRSTTVRSERDGTRHRMVVWAQTWITNAGENTAIPLAAVEDSLTGFLTRGEAIPEDYRIKMLVSRTVYVNSMRVSRETVYDREITGKHTISGVKNAMIAYTSSYGGEIEDVLRKKYPERNIVVG